MTGTGMAAVRRPPASPKDKGKGKGRLRPPPVVPPPPPSAVGVPTSSGIDGVGAIESALDNTVSITEADVARFLEEQLPFPIASPSSSSAAPSASASVSAVVSPAKSDSQYYGEPLSPAFYC